MSDSLPQVLLLAFIVVRWLLAGFALLTLEKPLDADSKAGLVFCFGASAALMLISIF